MRVYVYMHVKWSQILLLVLFPHLCTYLLIWDGLLLMVRHSGFTKFVGQPMSSSYLPAVPFPARIIDAQLLPAQFSISPSLHDKHFTNIAVSSVPELCLINRNLIQPQVIPCKGSQSEVRWPTAHVSCGNLGDMQIKRLHARLTDQGICEWVWRRMAYQVFYVTVIYALLWRQLEVLLTCEIWTIFLYF